MRSGIAERLFALDTRSLALFRIALGLLVVVDAVGRLPDLTAHYTDAGAVPRAVIDELRGDDIPLSLYLLDGSATFAGALLVIHAAAGVAMVAGYRTKLATAAAWLLTFSIHHRNLLVANFGDLILRLLLFWSLFLPLGERASLDRRRATGPPAHSFLSWGSVGFIVQLMSIYFFSALHKTGTTWHDGTAVAVSLQNDSIAKLPQALIALEHPQLLTLLTHAVRYFELIGPLLLLVPLATSPLRIALVLAFWSFHLGLYTFLELGTFSFVCIAAWCALLPGALWDRLGVRAGPGPHALRKRQWPAIAFAILVVLSNLTTLRMDLPYPALLGASLRITGLYQSWDMFSPDPAPDDGWMLVVGRRADGGEEDLLRGGPVSWAKPPEVSSTFPNFRWANYMRALRHRRPAVRHAFADYMCRRANAQRRAAAQIETVTIFYLEDVNRSSIAPPRVGHVELLRETCEREAPR